MTAAIPALCPLVRRLLALPPNDFFYSMFRAWYLVCHMTEVVPRRLGWAQLKDSVLTIFGVYRGADANRHPAPEVPHEPLPVVDADRLGATARGPSPTRARDLVSRMLHRPAAVGEDPYVR